MAPCCSITATSSGSKVSSASARRHAIRAGQAATGSSRNVADWKRIGAERRRIFESPTKPVLTEAQKTLANKRAELARVLERLQDPDLRPGIARELRKHIGILEREIAELEQV